jgi:two-component system sensor histidine kinase KdpD
MAAKRSVAVSGGPWWRPLLRTSTARTVGAVGLVALAGAIVVVTDAGSVVAVLLLFTAVTAGSLGGPVAGVVAAVVAAAVANVWVTEPRGVPLTTTQDLAALVTFVAIGIVTGTLVQRLEEARRRADRREAEARTRLALGERLLSGAPLESVAVSAAEAMVVLTDLDGVELEGDGLHAAAGRGEGARWTELVEGPLVVRGAPARGGRVTPEDRELVRSLASVVHAGLAKATIERDAAEARVEAELSRSRAAFFAAAGHNLRTPLASLVAAVALLGDDDGHLAPEDRAEMLDTTRTELARLARLVDKVLALSRIEADAVEPCLRQVDLGGIAQVAVKRLGPLGRDHRFRVDVPAELAALRLDVTMIEQVLLNLLENAVQVAPPGSEIAVDARVEGRQVVLDVVDHGPGVAPELRERIFDEYARGDGLTGRGGSGLGLAIVRSLVQAQGGTVACLPTPGGGTTMSLRFPLQPAPARASGTPGGDGPAGPPRPAERAAAVAGGDASGAPTGSTVAGVGSAAPGGGAGR